MEHSYTSGQAARLCGLGVSTIKRWGWYPHGGGKIVINISPCTRLKGFRCGERGALNSLKLFIGLSRLPDHIGVRENSRVGEKLAVHGYRVSSCIETTPAAGPGNMLFLCAAFTKSIAGFSALGRRGKPAEVVADELCRSWLDFARTDASVDSFLGDQIIPYIALAEGISEFRCQQVSQHLRTNIKIVEQFLPVHFNCQAASGEVQVTGIGFSPS